MPALGFKAHIVLLYIQKSVIFSIYISINIDKFPELFTQVFRKIIREETHCPLLAIC